MPASIASQHPWVIDPNTHPERRTGFVEDYPELTMLSAGCTGGCSIGLRIRLQMGCQRGLSAHSHRILGGVWWCRAVGLVGLVARDLQSGEVGLTA